MNTDMLTNVALVIAFAALAAGLWFKPTRMLLAVALLVGGLALSSTLFMAFLGVPMMLAAGVLIYTECLPGRTRVK